MRVKIVMGNQEFYVIWNILKIQKFLMRVLYLILPPLILVMIILIRKVMNILRKEGTSKIKIHPLQCMLTFQIINTKR